jgi:uncharacterized protein (DUF1800 family)
MAIKRFGVGARPGELQAISADPRGSVLAQLGAPSADVTSALPQMPNQPGSHDAWIVTREFQIENAIAAKLAPVQAADAKVPAPAIGTQVLTDAKPILPQKQASLTPPPQPAAAPPKPVDPAGPIYQGEIASRYKRAVNSLAPFVERLVWFWSNHFCIAVNKDDMIRAMAGAYEREVIRPHVLGRFRDMLGAVAHHPAMQIYLDNRGSIGPDSIVGRWHARGLNENLARETMELHTLGVNGGYTQTDVTNFAKVLTGWTVADMEAVDPGSTIFIAGDHEPGPIEIMGRVYGEPGKAQLDHVLDDLARQPATSRFLAGKLAGHFVGPNPPPPLVAAMAETYMRTEGHLGEVVKTMLSNELAWGPQPLRTIPPWDYTVAVARALDIDPPMNVVERILNLLGQRTWEVQSPKGWDDNEDWNGTAALLERLDWADDIGRRFAGQRDVPALAKALYGSSLSPDTLLALQRAESRQQAVALLLMSPEMQRR